MVGGSGILGTAPTPRPALAAFGDSITAVIANNDSTGGYLSRLCHANGNLSENRGISGTLVTGSSANQGGVTRTADITGAIPAPSKVFVLYGTNDINAGVVIGAVGAAGSFTDSYKNMVSSLVGGLPAAKIYCIGILPRTSQTPNSIATYNAGIQSAITAVSNANVSYIDPTGWGLMQNNGSSSNYTDPNSNFIDGLHPNGKGYAIMQTRLQSLFAVLFRRFSLGAARAASRSAD